MVQGVLQGYQTVDESLRTVRGRIRIGDQITRRPGLMVPIEVTYDEFTVDIAENQILRSALRWMLSVPRLSPGARAGLGHLDGQLGGVGIAAPGTRLPEWRADRLNARYVPALRLAEIVLANCSAETGTGGLQMASFVVDMAKVYEDFVGTALTEALAGYPGGTRTAVPDLPRLRFPRASRHRRSRWPSTSFTRWTVARDWSSTPSTRPPARRGRYPNADHYQMLAYCTALQVPDRLAGLRRRRVAGSASDRNTGITVVEYPLDLSASPADLLAQIDAPRPGCVGRSSGTYAGSANSQERVTQVHSTA